MIPPSAPTAWLMALVGMSGAAAGWARRSDRVSAARARVRASGRPGSVPPPWFAASLRVAELDLDAHRIWPVARFGGVLVATLLAARWPLLLLVLGVAALGTAATGPARRRRRAAHALEAGLPPAIEALVARLASGSSLVQALQGASAQAGPVGPDLASVVARHRQGQGLQASLDAWARERPGTCVVLLADALALAGASGGSQIGALQGVGATLRERETLAREVRALGSQARASAAVLVATPVAFALVVGALDSRIGHVLFGSPLGWACVSGGLLLNGSGAWWMARQLGSVR